MEGIIRAWGKILAGYQPNLSIEITRECPLTCPGCYAYGNDHLGGDVTLRQLQDFKGQQLIDAMNTRAVTVQATVALGVRLPPRGKHSRSGYSRPGACGRDPSP